MASGDKLFQGGKERGELGSSDREDGSARRKVVRVLGLLALDSDAGCGEGGDVEMGEVLDGVGGGWVAGKSALGAGGGGSGWSASACWVFG